MRIAYFDCFSGISGDMALGALVDAGADFDSLKDGLSALGVGGYDLTAERVAKNGVAATSVTVVPSNRPHQRRGCSGKKPAPVFREPVFRESCSRNGQHHHTRAFSEIRRIIEGSKLSDSVKSRSVATFRRLGEAEAKVHNTDIEQIHFHEVGAVDAIVDIVGACICLELLKIDSACASPVPTFHGTAHTAHGTFPLPAPATAELLKHVPWRARDVDGEIVTPTGAAILVELAGSFGGMPPMSIESIGYGAGEKDFDIPNVLRVMVGEAVSEQGFPDLPGECKEVAVIETNIDDLCPQLYDVVMERLFSSGALDVYLTPIQMKKNRPATLLSVMCAPHDVDKMSGILFEETSTIGVRIDTRTRICLPRETISVDTKFGPIRVKVARSGGEPVNVQPEYEDCKAAAAKHAVSVKHVMSAATVAFYSS